MFMKDFHNLLREIRGMIDKYVDVVKLQEMVESLKSPVDFFAGEAFKYNR